MQTSFDYCGDYGLVNQEDFSIRLLQVKIWKDIIFYRKGILPIIKVIRVITHGGAIKRLERYDKGVLSPLYICFRPDSSKVDADFLAHYFESKKWYKGVADIAGEGARKSWIT